MWRIECKKEYCEIQSQKKQCCDFCLIDILQIHNKVSYLVVIVVSTNYSSSKQVDTKLEVQAKASCSNEVV